MDFFDGITIEEVQFAIDAMLKDSEGEEWRIDDSENFAGYSGWDLERMVQISELIHEHGEGAMKGYFSHCGSSDDVDEFSDVYLGCYKSEEDFCEEWMGEQGGICSEAEKIRVFDWATLDQFIDWERITRDAFINDFYSWEEGYDRVHVYLRA